MYKIIIVDDIKKTREYIENHIKKLFPEHEIFSFEGTQKALKEIMTLKNIDIIFFNNLENKNPNGIEFAKIVRSKNPATMLIYISDKEIPNYEHLYKLAQFGIDGYLTHPFSENILKFVILNSLNRIKSLQTYKTYEHINLEKAVDNLINTYKMLVKEEFNKKNTKMWLSAFKKNEKL